MAARFLAFGWVWSHASAVWSAAAVSASSMMLYRSSIDLVLCPETFMATRGIHARADERAHRTAAEVVKEPTQWESCNSQR